MSRKVRKICPSEAPPTGGASLTVGHRRAPVAVDDPCLGCVELHPVASGQLERAEELLRPLLGLVVQLVVALELALERELADQGSLGASIAPDRDVGFGPETVPEVELA